MRRALRASAGLSAADITKGLGVTRQAVSKWERGTRTPRSQLLEAYIAVLEELAS
jgi:transcriptional regulator with XRE-family HTH domain